MQTDPQAMMRYPAPDHRARRVRGPEQAITHEDGRIERRRLYIRTSKAMSFALAVELRERAHTLPVDGAETQ